MTTLPPEVLKLRDEVEMKYFATLGPIAVQAGFNAAAEYYEGKIAEKDAEINHLTYRLDKSNSDHSKVLMREQDRHSEMVGLYKKQQAVIEKLKELLLKEGWSPLGLEKKIKELESLGDT